MPRKSFFEQNQRSLSAASTPPPTVVRSLATRRPARNITERVLNEAARVAEAAQQQARETVKRYVPKIESHTLVGVGLLRILRSNGRDTDGAIHLYLAGVPHRVALFEQDVQEVYSGIPEEWPKDVIDDLSEDDELVEYLNAFEFDERRLTSSYVGWSMLVRRTPSRDSLRVIAWDPSSLTLTLKMEKDLVERAACGLRETQHIYMRLRFVKVEPPVLSAEGQWLLKQANAGISFVRALTPECPRGGTTTYAVPNLGLLQLCSEGTPARSFMFFLHARPRTPLILVYYQEADTRAYDRRDERWRHALRVGDAQVHATSAQSSDLMSKPHEKFYEIRFCGWDADDLTLHLDGEYWWMQDTSPQCVVHTRMVLTFAPLPTPADDADADSSYHFEPAAM